MDDRLSVKLAGSFARTTGMDFDDLLQEARIAYLRADGVAGGNDPHKSAFITFATWAVYRSLCSAADYDRRKAPPHEELFEWTAFDGAPSPEDAAIFRELLRQLPEDARTMVDLVLSDAGEFLGLSPSGARRALRGALGWPAERVNAAFAVVSRMLRGPVIRRSPI